MKTKLRDKKNKCAKKLKKKTQKKSTLSIIGLGKYKSGKKDLGSNKNHLKNFGNN